MCYYQIGEKNSIEKASSIIEDAFLFYCFYGQVTRARE